MEDTIVKTHPAKLKKIIVAMMAAGIVPMVWGDPGISKSAQIYQVADMLNLEPIDARLSQMEPGDLIGYPFPQDGRLTFLPTDLIPLEGTPLPDGKDGWLLFFDEVNHAAQDTAKAFQKVVLDRMVGQYKMHPECHMICAGNLESNRAGANKMTTSNASRLGHIYTYADLDQYLDDFALVVVNGIQNIDQRIVDFLLWKPEVFHVFDPNSLERTFPCPRTYHFLSRAIRPLRDDQIDIELVAGLIGTGTGHEFLTYVQNRSELPTLEQICADPKGTKVPTRGDIIYTLLSTFIMKLTVEQTPAVLTYIEPMSMEYQQYLMQGLSKRKTAALACPEAAKWVAKFAKEVIA